MTKAKVKHFKIESLEATFSVVIGDEVEACCEAFDKEFIDCKSEELDFSLHTRALVYQTSSALKGDPDMVHLCTIMFLPKETGGQEHRYIAHEAVHAAYYIIDVIGIKIDSNNHEILAKLVDYIFQEVVEFIDGKGK
jgi:hypothetical protein